VEKNHGGNFDSLLLGIDIDEFDLSSQSEKLQLEKSNFRLF
jgi:hypothetical protein